MRPFENAAEQWIAFAWCAITWPLAAAWVIDRCGMNPFSTSRNRKRTPKP